MTVIIYLHHVDNSFFILPVCLFRVIYLLTSCGG